MSMLFAPYVAANTDTYNFRVKRAPIAKALFEFAKQSGVSISRPSVSYRDGKTRFLKGVYGIDEALERMLYGTDFTYEVISPRSVRIFRKPRVIVRAINVAHSVEMEEMPVREILVSSLRRVDTVQNLPYSISAVTSVQQEHLRAQSTGDIAHRLSNIYVTNQGSGQNKITIRGLSDGAFAGKAQSVVSTYQDNTRLTFNAPEPGLRLIDIDRIEVLRGPQGTLYGSGALSGLYRVVNKRPNTGEVELQASVSYAWTKNGDAVKDVSTIVNVPIVENKLAFRAAGYATEEGGYIDDVRLNIPNTNRSDTFGGRAALMFEPNENWQITLGSNFQALDADDTNYYNGKRRRLQRDNYMQEPYSDTFSQLYLTVNADLGWADLMTNVAWLRRDIDKVWDGSLVVPKLVNLDVIASPFTEKRDIKTFISETHLSGKSGGRIEWLLGSFYSSRDDTVSSSLVVPGASNHPLLGGADEIYSEDLVDDLKEVAFFGELTYFLNERLSVTAGLRWFDYKDKATSVIDDIGVNLERQVDGNQQKSGVTPKAVLSYHINDDSLFYGQISQGYRVGGTNLLGPNVFDVVAAESESTVPTQVQVNVLGNYNSDKLTNIEVGYKTQVAGGALTMNAAAFYAKWTDIQSLEYDYLGLPKVNNVGHARIIGAEFDFLYRPVQHAELQGNVSYSGSKITDTTFLFGARVGDSLPGVPKFSAGLSGFYEVPISPVLTAMVSADYVYVGGADLLFARFLSPKIDPYHLVNMRVSFLKGSWVLTVFANNLFDSKANSFSFGNPFSFMGDGLLEVSDQFTPLRPRTVGIELGWRF